MSQQKQKTVRVRLLVGRTRMGRAGTVVDDYPLDDAVRHQARGRVVILDEPKPKEEKPRLKPKEEKPPLKPKEEKPPLKPKDKTAE